MSINSVSNTHAANAYQSYAKAAKPAEPKKEVPETSAEKSGVIYEPNTELIAKLKSDADARTEQMRNLVQQLMTKQGTAYAQANDIWKFLASGNFTVDPATKAQAQADIAEDGYWGVEQTSQRIIDFATALTGGDPDKIEEMRAAFEKGFKMATKAWGGSLPDISQRTYEAVMKKFDALAGVTPAEDGVTE